MPDPAYLLDTNVLLALIRGGPLGTYIDSTFGLRRNLARHAICVVAKGEIRTLALANGWGSSKRSSLDRMLESLVCLDVGDDLVINAYAELMVEAKQHPKGSQSNRGENDIRIAATARASGSILLTTDRDFDVFYPAMIDRRYIDPTSRPAVELPN